MVQIMGTYDTPPQMPDTSDLEGPFKTMSSVVSVGCYATSSKWGSSEDVQRDSIHYIINSKSLDEY